jgi:hypothetical protein
MNLSLALIFMTVIFGILTDSRADGYAKSKTRTSEKSKEQGFSLNTSLSSRTDLASEMPERDYTHSLSIAAGFGIDQFLLSANTAYTYTSLNNSILDRQYSADGISDSTLGLTFMELYSTTFVAPTSASSQYEGLKGAATLAANYKHSAISPKVSMNHGLKYNYLFNSYVYSPISGRSTYEMTLAYSLGIEAQIVSQLAMGMGFDAQTSRLNDGSIEMGSSINSSFSLSSSYKFQRLTLGVSYGSGNFFDDKFQNNWFLNQYQQVIALKLGFKWL